MNVKNRIRKVFKKMKVKELQVQKREDLLTTFHNGKMSAKSSANIRLVRYENEIFHYLSPIIMRFWHSIKMNHTLVSALEDSLAKHVAVRIHRGMQNMSGLFLGFSDIQLHFLGKIFDFILEIL